MRGNLKFRVRQLASALLASAALVAVAGLAGAAWDGTQEINLGDKVAAEFAVADTHHHEFSFWAPKNTVLNVKAKVASGLVLEYALHNQLDADQPLGATVSEKGIKNYVILADSYYTLQVSADSGSGVYELTTSGKFPTKIAGTVTADTAFGAMNGALCSASVKASKTEPVGAATITSVKLPGGTVAGVTVGVASFKNLLLPKSTTYTLDLTFATAGNVETSISLKTKLAKRSWSFGVVEVPEGTSTGVQAEWKASPHNDLASYPFQYFLADGDTFSASHKACAKCHSTGGYQDWVGADGTAFEVVNNFAATGTTVDCNACHNTATATLSTVLFPSGKRINDLGAEAICMQCHQGVESANSVDTVIGATAIDAQIAGQGPFTPAFKNVHYLAAAATLYGREVEGGYQYEGEDLDRDNVLDAGEDLNGNFELDRPHYNGLLEHVDDYRTCIQCHDQHSTELRLTECAQCHAGVTDYAALKNIRMTRSTLDYDGDTNTTEGMAHELSGLAAALFTAIQDYADAQMFPIAYDSHAYPYFFNDTNGNGTAEASEAVFANNYTHWTPRLLRAAYNYQYYQKDPGAYAHNSRYTMQILYDSIEELDAHPDVTVANFADMHRGDEGHFDATSLAFRDWDKAEGDSDGLVNINCAQCHSSAGFVLYASTVTTSTELSIIPPEPAVEGMRCESCHQPGVAAFSKPVPPLRYIPAVWFASTKLGGTTKLTNGSLLYGEDKNDNGALDSKEDLDGDGVLDRTFDPSFTCMTCHQGRNSNQTITDYILVQNTAPKASSSSFQNVHYYPAGGVLYGTTAKMGLEYTGRTYAAPFSHEPLASGPGGGVGNRCTYCHLADHTFKPQLTDGTNGNPNCIVCHGEAGGDVEAIRKNRSTDYNVNGSNTEHLSLEVQSFADALYAQIKAYAISLNATNPAANGKAIYYSDGNPYFYYAVDGDDIKDDRGEDIGTPGHLDWANNGRLDTEDLNGNGVLDPKEDTDNDGILDPGEDKNANGKLDPAEDTDGDTVLDREDSNGNKIFDSDWAAYPFWKDDVQNATVAAQGRMLKAAHNYNIWKKEPGAWAHNTKYIIQLLYDSLDDLDDGLQNDSVTTLPGGSAPPARP